MKTWKEKLVAGLLAMGFTQDVNSRSQKYAAFNHPQRHDTLFVGKSGALRAGLTVASSYSVGDPSNQSTLYKMVIAHVPVVHSHLVHDKDCELGDNHKECPACTETQSSS